ncbi:MAG: hypothetical protein Fur002_24590 [Anaerolineales bacterium]
MFSKILIANRGEIAIRIIRACREMGIQTVAVYSEADQDALHVQMADEAILLGAAAPSESYLNAEKIIAAALQTGAEAIHPGYGFLSENADFAQRVEESALAFIGPASASIRAMGDKAESKIKMKAAGVPTVPGFEGLSTVEEFERAAAQIGYPVLVKAAAGGGGKGMRVIASKEELREGVEAARREALNAFGDERLLVEKYLANAHHIEFQVFGDQHGNLIHLFERECSVQRRHQKIIEETPSPLLTPQLREAMGAAAVKAAKAANYFNAGTIEFIFDAQTNEYYFLEMNTRLQVEHPITEISAGLDLVRWQIRVAAGERFPFTQADFAPRGHVLECRVYAEDPAAGFLPSVGKLLKFIEPKGPGVRVDSGFVTGSEVSHFYDPLLAKLIVSAETRAAAIQKMQNALRNFVAHGVVSNIDFMQAVLRHEDFARGAVTTQWVEERFGAWTPPEVGADALIAAALADVLFVGAQPQTAAAHEANPFSPWKKNNSFRVN